ncbi:MAG: hypothetical protein C4520_08575 [Candidatus Abyssobacteria bacterium SURF_5]|uniref:Uncharacterized protein n=1 Tax=Abyssobacteria bacterium (strain SURF_5) TaxID=2093360 RepID=A0A3A4NT78_ABYX5|nr:MAG: hypothetical protein C4520_08575 [Candidatus Abyssubacteria bacterium SURF_5]
MAFLVVGCASLDEDYSTRFGLANPEYPLIPPTPTDEAYPKGSVGQQYIEEYDKKYHEEEVLPPLDSQEAAQQEAAE